MPVCMYSRNEVVAKGSYLKRFFCTAISKCNLECGRCKRKTSGRTLNTFLQVSKQRQEYVKAKQKNTNK